jgi:uncharacterized protein (TIGR03435 family)
MVPAMQDQLGLRLERRRAPVEIFIDGAERPSEKQ